KKKFPAVCCPFTVDLIDSNPSGQSTFSCPLPSTSTLTSASSTSSTSPRSSPFSPSSQGSMVNFSLLSISSAFPDQNFSNPPTQSPYTFPLSSLSTFLPSPSAPVPSAMASPPMQCLDRNPIHSRQHGFSRTNRSKFPTTTTSAWALVTATLNRLGNPISPMPSPCLSCKTVRPDSAPSTPPLLATPVPDNPPPPPHPRLAVVPPANPAVPARRLQGLPGSCHTRRSGMDTDLGGHVRRPGPGAKLPPPPPSLPPEIKARTRTDLRGLVCNGRLDDTVLVEVGV
ncbi:hypothetical protein BC938DRAFT_476382, partial [Jimgerdemannia flammicorona]